MKEMDDSVGAWQDIAADVLSEKKISETVNPEKIEMKSLNLNSPTETEKTLTHVNSEREFSKWYTPLISIGSGAYGKVYKATNTRQQDIDGDDNEVAIKEVELYAVSDDMKEQKKAEEEGVIFKIAN